MKPMLASKKLIVVCLGDFVLLACLLSCFFLSLSLDEGFGHRRKQDRPKISNNDHRMQLQHVAVWFPEKGLEKIYMGDKEERESTLIK